MSSHIPRSDLYAAPESQPGANGPAQQPPSGTTSPSTDQSIKYESMPTQDPPTQSGAAAPPATVQQLPVGISATELLGTTALKTSPRVEVKLFVGRLPKTMEDVLLTPLFTSFGEVLETVIIRDKASGTHKGSAFVKMASITDADKAIRALHNIKVLDNQLGPVQVKYANGEAERLGLPVESAQPGVDLGKLFVGSLPRGVTEAQVREVFEPYGTIEEVVLMKDAGTGQTKGCAFVKFTFKENAIHAIKQLNGQHQCSGCARPLEVKFAESRRAAPALVPGVGAQMPGAAAGPIAYGIAGRAPPTAAVPSNLNPRSGGGWTEYFTSDGRPYYHNEVTKTTQWSKPPEFDRVAPPPAGPVSAGSATDVAGPPGANVFVFHIPNEWTQTEVTQHFSPFGRVISCYIATDRTTGRNKGYGFVSFDTVEAAANAVMGMNGFLVGSKRLKVSIKTGEEGHVSHLLNPQQPHVPQQQQQPQQNMAYGQQRGYPPQQSSAYPQGGNYGVGGQGYSAPGYSGYGGSNYGPAATGAGAPGYGGGMAGGSYRAAPY